MNLARLAIWCGVAVVFLSACGEDAKPARNRSQFCFDWAAAACSSEVVSVCQAEDADTCRDSQEDFCRDLVPEDFSDAMGDECIDAVKGAYKDGDLQDDELAIVLRLGPPCDQLLVGRGGEGDACVDNNDCDTSLLYACVHKADAEGTCQIPEIIGAGRKCNQDQQTCEEGFYCNGSNCIETKIEDADCATQEECGVDGFCSDDGKCVARLAVGDPCTADLQCEEGICYDFEGEKVCTNRIRLSRSEPICDSLR